MTCEVPSGWGSGFGVTPWGSGDDSYFRILDIFPYAENEIRIAFNKAVNYTGVLDPKDASNVARYSIKEDSSSIGNDGLPARKVTIVSVLLIPFSDNRTVRLILDRPMSPYPAKYFVSANNIYSFEMIFFDLCFSSKEIFGLFKGLFPLSPSEVVSSKDIANPNYLSASNSSGIQVEEKNLGIIPVSSDGDYAYDSGIVNLKKRVYRRLVTKKNAFSHLPGYGVGLLTYGKKLNTAYWRSLIVNEATNQILQEPDVERCSVTITNDPKTPNLVWINVLVKQKQQPTAFKLGYPFKIT